MVLPQFVLPTGAAYAQVYVANESNVPVWFDEVQIAYGPGLQVQEQHYDPFGLDLAGLSRSTPGLRTLNQYQWNGKEKQSDFGLGWTHLDWRFFDPQTGRFHTVDPLSNNGQEMWSTYQFGFDNAVRYNDPDGRFPEEDGPQVGSVFGMIRNTIVGTGVSLVNASIMSVPSLDAVTTLTMGGTLRASMGSDGEVSYGIRPTAKTVGGFIANEVSDKLDMAAAAITVLTAGEGAAVGGGLKMGAGLLLEQASGKIATNAVVQEGKALARTKGAFTEPKLPNKTVAQGNGVEIVHYTKSGDHGPPHLHVKGGGAETRIGQAGKPLANNPALTSKQQVVVSENKAAIRKAAGQIGRYVKYQNR